MKKHIIILNLLLFGLASQGQSNILNASIPDEIGEQNEDQLQSDKDSFLLYNYLDDKDILWSKIVYEFIDLDEKLNFPLLFPLKDDLYETTRKSLWRVLKENILSKDLGRYNVNLEDVNNIYQIYSERNDNFRDFMDFSEIDDKINVIEDLNGNITKTPITSDQIIGYNIKGIWYFDKMLGEMRYRLLALMPLVRTIDDNTGDELVTRLFWIWYPSIRDILHTELVYNDKNNATRISFDQLLVSRRFNSYIYKEDNMYEDRDIRAYKNPGLETILESERIKKEILDFENDMWNR